MINKKTKIIIGIFLISLAIGGIFILRELNKPPADVLAAKMVADEYCEWLAGQRYEIMSIRYDNVYKQIGETYEFQYKVDFSGLTKIGIVTVLRESEVDFEAKGLQFLDD